MNRLTYFTAARQASRQLKKAGCDPNGLRYWFKARHRWDDTHWLLMQREIIPDHEKALAKAALEQLLKHEPPQYVAGYAPFYGRWFKVNQSVLIPEFETTELIDWCLEDLPTDQDLRVLDLGTGSGCIATTLALERPRWILTASDISVDALKVAKANINALAARVRLVHSDLFDQLAGEQFDVMVTNPPYVATNETAVMDRSVKDYEPSLALFAGSDGLDFYRRLFQHLPSHLTDGGQLIGETGYRQEESIVKEFNRLLPGATITTRHDAAGKMRMIHGCDFSNAGGK